MDKIKQFFKKKKKTLLSLLGSILLLLAAGGVGVFLALYETYNPKKYMDEFYECFINEGYAAMYKSAQVKESEFIDQDSFVQMMVNDLGYEDTDSYSLGKVVKSGEFATSKVSFTDSETKEKVTWDLTLQKSKEKKYLFFNEWDVNINDFIIEKVKFVAPKGVDVIVDGRNLTVDDIKGVKTTVDEETGLITYIVDRMFAGSHNIMFIGAHTEVKEVITQFDKDRKFYAFRDGDLKAEIQQSMLESSKNIVLEMYNASLTGAGIDTLIPMFANVDGVVSSIELTYNGMSRDINKEDGSTLNSIDITDYKVVFDRYAYEDRIQVVFNYTASYAAKGSRTVIDGVRERYEGVGNASATITFKYIEDSWKPVNIDMQCIDYSLPEEEEE